MKPAVELIRNGRCAWKNEPYGWLLRIKGIAIVGFLSIFGALLFSLNSGLSTLIIPDVEVRMVVSSTILIFGVFCVHLLIYFRKRTLRSLNIKYTLHQLSHMIRDEQTNLYKLKAENQSKQQLGVQFQEFLVNICEISKKYFSLLTYDSVDIVIRLAVLEQEKVVYRTYARSNGLNKDRSNQSEDIPLNGLVSQFLRNNGEIQGIILYNDFCEAEKLEWYTKTKNDILYPNEIKTAVMAPINTWDGKKQDMIGILYITSKKRNVFSAKHIDSVLFVGDMIASAISNSIKNQWGRINGVNQWGQTRLIKPEYQNHLIIC